MFDDVLLQAAVSGVHNVTLPNSSGWRALAIFTAAVLAFGGLLSWWSGMPFWVAGLIATGGIVVNGFIAGVEDDDFSGDQKVGTPDEGA